MLIKIVVLLGVLVHVTATYAVDGRFNPMLRTIRDIRLEQVKRSIAHLNQFAGFDTLGGMGLGKRSEPAEQAGEKRAALSTFDSLAGMGLGKRSGGVVYDYQKRNQLSQLDTLGGMGFGRK